MAAKIGKIQLLKNVTIYSTYLVIIWGFYRFLFQFPQDIEELVIKPILWIVPLLIVLRKENLGLSSIGYTFKNLFPSIYLSVGLGAIFALAGVITNILKYGGLNFAANIGNLPLFTSLGISFATAFSEETAFRGYIFGKLWNITKNELMANFISTFLWTIIHIPIAFFIWKLNLTEGILYLVLTSIFGLGSAFIYGKTRNIWSSIFLHVLWEWPIILFR